MHCHCPVFGGVPPLAPVTQALSRIRALPRGAAIWVAFVLQLLSGFTLWMTKPTRYVADSAFVIMFSLVVVGVILTLYLYATMKREDGSWEAKGLPLRAALNLPQPLCWSGAAFLLQDD